MIREAQFDAQCAECGGRITAGEEMTYLAPTGDRPPFTAHYPKCPEQQKRRQRGINIAPREDAEELFAFRDCEGCGTEFAVKRDSPAATAPTFLAQCCDGQPKRQA
jgi:hypothetical protein